MIDFGLKRTYAQGEGNPTKLRYVHDRLKRYRLLINAVASWSKATTCLGVDGVVS
jgi:hypothetical protein